MNESCKLLQPDEDDYSDDDMFPGEIDGAEGGSGDENDEDDATTTEPTEYEKCTRSKEFMVLLRQMAGCGAFDAYQTIHCQCVEKSKVEANMERDLRLFYQEYNPDGVDKGMIFLFTIRLWNQSSYFI